MLVTTHDRLHEVYGLKQASVTKTMTLRSRGKKDRKKMLNPSHKMPIMEDEYPRRALSTPR